MSKASEESVRNSPVHNVTENYHSQRNSSGYQQTLEKLRRNEQRLVCSTHFFI